MQNCIAPHRVRMCIAQADGGCQTLRKEYPIDAGSTAAADSR